MSEERINKVEVYAPFLQRRYIKSMREKIEAAQSQPDTISPEQRDKLLEELHHMTVVLEKDSYAEMQKELPEQYWAIMSRYGDIGKIGSTSDPDDIWAEEPDCWLKPISKEEFEEE